MNKYMPKNYPAYQSGLTQELKDEVLREKSDVEGMCCTSVALTVLRYFEVDIDAHEIKNQLKDHGDGCNQIEMVRLLRKYLKVTFLVNYDIKSELEQVKKGEESKLIPKDGEEEFLSLLDMEDISFMQTPQPRKFIELLNERKDALAILNLYEGADPPNHWAVIDTVSVIGRFDFFEPLLYKSIPESVLEMRWDRKGQDHDPERLALIVEKKG